jgi:hypothetical protein
VGLIDGSNARVANRITGEPRKSVGDERVADGLVVIIASARFIFLLFDKPAAPPAQQ